MSLPQFRDEYLELLLRFVWREWTTLGVAGQDMAAPHHVIDPEALLLLTCSLGRYDQRLFDEVMEWLAINGRFLNVQRMKNILKAEAFRGGNVLSAVADWLHTQKNPLKWRLLAGTANPTKETQNLFYLPNGRALPKPKKADPAFLEHGFVRNPVELRGHGRSFPPNAVPCLLLKMRALFGVNTRCDVLTYLALNKTGHPREAARELYYSQKAIHDVLTDMACSGVVHSSRAARERIFRIASGALPFLVEPVKAAGWLNWPVLLSSAEAVWYLVEGLCSGGLDPAVESSEIHLAMKPLLDRLARAPWGAPFVPSRSCEASALLELFAAAFEKVAIE